MSQIKILIVLLNIFWKFKFAKTSGECYSKTNIAKFCQPNFINIIHNATVIATTTCGTKGYTENICSTLPPNNCLNCDNRIEKLSRNISRLFDHHLKGSETCWISGKMPESKIIDVINVTINFDKLYEAYYIAIEFCGELPDSIVLFKSIDNGQKWLPWHFFSTSCQKTFKMRRMSSLKMKRKPKIFNFDPVCVSLPKKNLSMTSEYQVIAFNPMIGRTTFRHDSMTSKQWTSLTNLKISMIVDNSGKTIRHHVSHIGISDITIGGRAQCYGHAAKMRELNDSIVCHCNHKTHGRDCTECIATHNDQPWKPMFSSGSLFSECQKCFCNNHASECLFDETVYRKNNKLHGSQCIDCLHHTTGPHCDSCLPGFFRNMAFSINHTQACQKCNCHIIGANTTKHCDTITGNCYCKEGVEGSICNRCKKGFHQTRSSSKPCSPDVLKKMMASEERCDLCGKARPRIKFKKFCRQDIMIKMSIQSKETHGYWTRFGARVETIWRPQAMLQSHVNLHNSEYSIYPIWVENANIRCNCPSFELGQMYLLLTKIKQKMYLKQPELIIDRKSTILKWRNSWSPRLSKFTEREKQGKCFQFKSRRRYSNQMFKQYRIRYMNDG